MRFKILGIPYTVKFVKTPSDSFGETFPDRREIEIYEHAHKEYPKKGDTGSTLFHECVHTSLVETGLAELLDPKLEEAICVAIENGVFPLVKKGIFNERSEKGF